MPSRRPSSRAGFRTRGRPIPTRADEERTALMQIASAAAGANGLEDILEMTADAACEAMAAGSFAVSRWDNERRVLQTLVNAGDLGPGEERRPDDETYAPEDHPSIGRLLTTKQPYANAVDDPEADPRAIELLERLGKESDIGVPIIVDDELWGELWATTSPGEPRFRARDVRFLEAIAGQLVGVIAREAQFSKVARMAFEDELTGLANRRALEEELDEATARWRRESVPLTLLVCDVDELKTINDDRGHHAGDRALKRVGRALVKAASPYPAATVARISGDEFAVVLPGTGLSAATEVAGTALRILGAERDTRVSVSCGAAVMSADTDRPELLMRAADTAQYAAKRRGGGQICTAGTDAFHESMAATGRPIAPTRRRGRRRGIAEILDETQADLVALLDGTMAQRPVLDRLEAVCAAFAGALNAAEWSISLCPHGSGTLHTVSSADTRDGRLQGVRLGLEDDNYELNEYPLTAGVMARGSGWFVVDRHDAQADNAERELLMEMGHAAVLGAAVSDIEATYLIELYADGDTRDLSAATMAVSLLARAAVAYASTVVDGVRALRKRTRHRDVCAALSHRLARASGEREVIDAALDELDGVLSEDFVALVCREPGDRVAIAGARGRLAPGIIEPGWGQPANVGMIGQALREGVTVVTGDVNAEPEYRRAPGTEMIRSTASVPIWAGDRIWGVVEVEDQRIDAFDDDDQRLARAVADQVGSALRADELHRRVSLAYVDTAEAIGAALEGRDSYSASHGYSIAAHADAVGRALGLDADQLRDLRLGVAFHDLGKLGIPDTILTKVEPLQPEEWARIEEHTLIGERILEPIEFLAAVRPIVRHCHERWDGSGYPDRLAGEEIPLAARIVFACDAFDAMTTVRPYREQMSRAEALDELERGSGTQFDPSVVAALVALVRDPGAATAVR